MSNRSSVAVLLVLILLLSLAPLISRSHAQVGSIAVSGNFSGWEFKLPQGSEIGGLERFLVVFNNTGDPLDFTIGTQGPQGVDVEFSEAEFTLEPGRQKRIFVTVKASENAVPGEYELLATVTASRITPTGGIGVAAAVAQRAKVIIIGESGHVNISTASPQGQPVVAVVRLYRAFRGRQSEVAFSETGLLNARVSPGNYNVRVFIGGERLAEESFAVASDETKTITFTLRTVFLSDVTVTAHYRVGTTEISFATLEYTLTNLDQPVADVRVILNVSKDETPFEEASILTLDALNIGSTRGSHNYIPAAGWSQGLYGLRLDLYIRGRLYTTSLDSEIVVEPLSTTSPVPTAQATSAPAPSNATPTPAPTLTLVVPAAPTLSPAPTQTPVSIATVTLSPASTPEAGPFVAVAMADISAKVSDTGRVLEDIKLTSRDQRATIKIPEGTVALTAQGSPIKRIEILDASQPFSPLHDASILGSVYNFSPDGATFSPPISLGLGFDPVIFSLGVSPDNLLIMRFDSQQGWVALNSRVDQSKAVVIAQVSHFTQFALVALSAPSLTNWPLIGGIIGGVALVVIVTGIGLAYVSRRRR